MKKIFPILSLIVLSLVVISCNNEPKQVEIPTTKAKKTELLAENKQEVDMKVEGMVCAMGCAKYIEDKVADLEGVVLSRVDYEEGTAHFEYDKSSLSSEEIEDFINNIHDGQYKAKIADNNSEIEVEEEVEETSSDEESQSVVSVTDAVNISFPELFTFFLKQIR